MKLTWTGTRFEARFEYDPSVKDQVKGCGFMFDGKALVWWTTKATTAAKLSKYADESAKAEIANAQGRPPMTLTFSDGRFELRFDYDPNFVEKAKAAGMRWDKEVKCWWVKDSSTAAKFAEFADESAKVALAKGSATVAASQATTIDGHLPRPEGLEYMDFQKAGIAFAVERPVTLIADEMGLGKTIQAIGVINAVHEIRNVLVICPASLKRNWERELKKWLVAIFQIEVVEGKTGAAKVELNGNPQIVIINYDIIGSLAKEIEWDLLIVDEAHYLKGDSLRTKRILGSKNKKGEVEEQGIKAARKLWLTGTPIVNRPKELWNILHASDPVSFSNFFAFAKRYCDARQNKWGWDFSGASNLEELQGKLRSTMMVRRMKRDVLKDLPAKRRQVVELNGLDKEMKASIRAEEEAMEAKKDAIEAAQARVDVARLGDNEEEFKAALEALRMAYRVAFEEMSRIRHQVALAKVPAVLEWLDDAELDKVVVFAHHHDVIDQIKAHFGSAAVELTGETPNAKRQEAVDRFQEDPSCKVFIGSIQAAGVGITLTSASHVVFAELDWVPGNMSQAEDRCHRIGQDERVNIYHLVLNGSLDARMAHLLVEKQEWIDRLTDAERLQPVEPIRIQWKNETPEQVEIREGLKKSAKTHVLGFEIEKITVEQVAEVHQALRVLAGVCDGAVKRDGCGFNGGDSRVGHELAGRAKLTKSQAILGYKVLQKYHRQVGLSFKL